MSRISGYRISCDLNSYLVFLFLFSLERENIYILPSSGNCGLELRLCWLAGEIWLRTGFCVTTNQRRDSVGSRALIGWHYVMYDCSVFSTEECGRLLALATVNGTRSLLTVTKPVAWSEREREAFSLPLLSDREDFCNKEIRRRDIILFLFSFCR